MVQRTVQYILPESLTSDNTKETSNYTLQTLHMKLHSSCISTYMHFYWYTVRFWTIACYVLTFTSSECDRVAVLPGTETHFLPPALQYAFGLGDCLRHLPSSRDMWFTWMNPYVPPLDELAWRPWGALLLFQVKIFLDYLQQNKTKQKQPNIRKSP